MAAVPISRSDRFRSFSSILITRSRTSSRPVDHLNSKCDIYWMVRGDAVEGKDYDLDEADMALGCHDRGRQDDHRQQLEGRSVTLLPARPVQWSGTSRT